MRVPNPSETMDFFRGLTESEVRDILLLVPDDTHIRFLDYIRRVPRGLLGLIGAPETGKTEMISIITAARVIAWSKISFAAPSNAAVNAFILDLSPSSANLTMNRTSSSCDRIQRILRSISRNASY